MHSLLMNPWSVALQSEHRTTLVHTTTLKSQKNEKRRSMVDGSNVCECLGVVLSRKRRLRDRLDSLLDSNLCSIHYFGFLEDGPISGVLLSDLQRHAC